MTTNNYPKVLVVSHNPFSLVQSNGKTLSAFFKGWPKEKIAQVFLTLDDFDDSICPIFYRISDIAVLKKFIMKKDCGERISKKNKQVFLNDKETMHKSRIYIIFRNIFKARFSLAMLIRSFVWNRVKPWLNKDFNNWLKEYNPDVIFFQSSNVYAIFDMVDYISNTYNIPIIMETTDDYVTPKFSINPFYLLNISKMKKRYKNMVKKVKCVFAIGEKMANEYFEHFGGNFKIAMNSIDISSSVIPYDMYEKKDNFIFTYAGNLGLNRWKVLLKIGQSLDRIKKTYGIQSVINIYSLDVPNKKILKKFSDNVCIKFMGSVNSKELISIRNSSDFLIHVESFDRKNRIITRLSVSTKIPEYLLSQRCILAVGPSDVASIEYIEKEKIGKVISKLTNEYLDKEILKFISTPKEKREYIKNGITIADRNHNPKNILKIVQSEIIKCGVK